MYQALYRKWRPRVFEDVAGQPHITATLRREIEAGRIAHAYIFTGSRGTGKTTCAKILAKAVNCLSPHDGDPCNECEICRGIDSGSVLDVTEIDAASNNGVDNIRELREEAGFTPARAKYRVYIIDEAHMLSAGAFNALLKTLEEPPAYVIFILATTEVHKIPATILSRCQRFDFRRIPSGDIARRLQYIAGQEHFTLTDDAAMLIARLSDGGLRDALSLLDQCAASGAEITAQTVSDAAGLSGGEYLAELAAAIQGQDPSAAMKTIDRLYQASKDCERLCEELIGYFRNLMLLKTAGREADLLHLPANELDTLEQATQGFTAPALLHILDTLQETFERLRRSAAKRVELETCLLRLCVPELDTTPEALLRRVSSLEEALRAGTPAARAQAPATPPPARHSAPQEEQPPAGPEPSSTAQREEPAAPTQTAEPAGAADEPLACWPEVMEAVCRLDAPLCGVLNGSSAYLRGNVVLVDSSNSMFGTLIRQQGHQKSLVEAVRRVTGESYRVGVTKKSLEAKRDPMDEIAQNAAAAGLDVDETKA